PESGTVMQAGMTVPADQMRAEVASAKPANLWDLLTKPEGQGDVIMTQPAETFIVSAPAPKLPPAKPEPKLVKTEPAKPESKVVKSEPAKKSLVPAAKQVAKAEPAPMPKGP